MSNLLMLIFGLIFSFGMNVFAKDAHEYAEMAKSRSYPGGAEESDLKIQSADFFKRTTQASQEPIIEGVE